MKEFWLGFLLILMIYFGVISITGLVTQSHQAFKFVEIGITILLFWPCACLVAKRLHDLNLSAWLVLPILFSNLGQWVGLFCLGLIPGSEKNNEYGPASDGTTNRHSTKHRTDFSGVQLPSSIGMEGR